MLWNLLVFLVHLALSPHTSTNALQITVIRVRKDVRKDLLNFDGVQTYRNNILVNHDDEDGENVEKVIETNGSYVDIPHSLSRTWAVNFRCSAHCPIQWRLIPARMEMSGAAFTKITLHRETVLTQDNSEYHFSQFVSNLTINSYSNADTGTYICECISGSDNGVSETRLHVFWEGQYGPMLINALTETSQDLVELKPQRGTLVTLPCAPSISTIKVSCSCRIQSWDPIRVELNSSIIADQFFGYKLDLANLPGVGDYIWICSLTSNVTGHEGSPGIVQMTIQSVNQPELPRDQLPFCPGATKAMITGGRSAIYCPQQFPNCKPPGPPRLARLPVLNSISFAFLTSLQDYV